MLFINHIEIPNSPIILIEISGPLNTATSGDFEKYIDRLIEKNRIYIILDAEKLEFVSSEGVGVMLYMYKQLHARNGFLSICRLAPEISTLYKLLGFDRVISIAPSKEEAVEIMEKQIEIRESPEYTERAKSQPESIPDSDPEEFNGKTDFKSPLIVECAQCLGLIRVTKNGKYQCPDCLARFSVTRDQTVVF